MKCGRGGIPVAEKSPDTREKRYDAKDVTKDIVDLGYEVALQNQLYTVQPAKDPRSMEFSGARMNIITESDFDNHYYQEQNFVHHRNPQVEVQFFGVEVIRRRRSENGNLREELKIGITPI